MIRLEEVSIDEVPTEPVSRAADPDTAETADAEQSATEQPEADAPQAADAATTESDAVADDSPAQDTVDQQAVDQQDPERRGETEADEADGRHVDGQELEARGESVDRLAGAAEPADSEAAADDVEATMDATARDVERIVVRPRPELADALDRAGVAADEDYDRAIPEVDQLVDDEGQEQLAEPMLAEPAGPADEESEGEDAGEAGIQRAVSQDGAPSDEPRREEAAVPPVADPGPLPLDAAVEAPQIDDDTEVPELTDTGPLSRVLVAVLLTAREPMKLVRLAEICNSTQKAVAEALERLDEDLKAMGMPLEVVHAGETIRLGTAPQVFPYLLRLRKARKAERLSPAALETLAVVAYRQPVIRAEIEAIRGVKVGPMLKSLLDHKLVKVVGRAEDPGRPLQYGTTQLFLERFGLRSLKDLPSVQEFRSLG